jgi:hypothetical protein
MFLFSTVSRLTVVFTEYRIKGVQWDFSPGVKRPGREANNSPPSSADVKNNGVIPALPHMSSYAEENFIFLLFM